MALKRDLGGNEYDMHGTGQLAIGGKQYSWWRRRKGWRNHRYERENGTEERQHHQGYMKGFHVNVGTSLWVGARVRGDWPDGTTGSLVIGLMQFVGGNEACDWNGPWSWAGRRNWTRAGMWWFRECTYFLSKGDSWWGKFVGGEGWLRLI